MANRYNEINTKQVNNLNYYLNPIYPNIPESEQDIYLITTINDRYDKLALQFYKDASLWWLIAFVNNANKDSLILETGKQIRIPLPKERILNIYNTANRFR